MNYNIEKHNEEFAQFSELCKQGKQPRIQMSIASNPRMILMDDKLNTDNVTFRQYFENPETMIEIQCQFQEYSLNNLVWDKYMGVNENTRYHIYDDWQNIFEPAWFGCEIAYNGKNEPSTYHMINEDNKYKIFDNGLIDPFNEVSQKTFKYLEFFQNKAKEGYTWNGIPIYASNSFGMGTDGPMTVACSLYGATEFCMDLYDDTEFALALLDYIVENEINRIKTLRKHFGITEMPDSMGFADDSIALLSKADYIKYILPCHKKLLSSLSTMKNPNGIHLCGDAVRHFKTIRDELNVRSFDTGFPVNHGELVRDIGENVFIYGGPHVQILLYGTEDDVRKETKRILEDVLPCKNFLIKEANNLSPCTPPENLIAMYETVKEYGNYYV
ncbi:MAG: hypothetical protein FWF15_01630 [Oscillospiraceae bacterium]|nr:hypothetical protein [Oscillospiraceae bacterium]